MEKEAILHIPLSQFAFAEKEDRLVIRIRCKKGDLKRCVLLWGDRVAMEEPLPVKQSEMEHVASDMLYDYYEVKITSPYTRVCYYFRLEDDTESLYYYGRGFAEKLSCGRAEYFQFPYIRREDILDIPEWAEDIVMYHIFPDSFANDRRKLTEKATRHMLLPDGKSDSNGKILPDRICKNHLGGTLKGICENLDYIEKLGINCIYLNPIFVSPSNHKYDIQDYDYVDPHFGKIVKDGGECLPEGCKVNKEASKYIMRVTDKANLEASNELFAQLVEEIHKRGMRVILDGVFNHCGSFNKWLDRECIYENQEGYEKGAYVDYQSPYRSFFKFQDPWQWPYNGTYNGWWGHDTLPKLNYEESEKLYEYIMRIGEKWVSPPYNVDGWRLDVAADLGYTEEFNHRFWRDFRTRVKEANPDALILAEHYGDPKAWLLGDQWDTVMNYDAFMEPITWFLTGVEKHSDEFRGDLLGNPDAFTGALRHHMSRFNQNSLEIAMNELSNHDHSRFLTRTNRRVGRIHTMGPEAAGENINKGVFREAVVFQMTWPGAPTIYYGDEAGLCGWTDPDNRRGYPWGREDQELIQFHRDIIKVHKDSAALMKGSVMFLHGEYKVVSYGRFLPGEAVVVILNNDYEPHELNLHVRRLGVQDGAVMKACITTTESGYQMDETEYVVANNKLKITVGPISAVVLKYTEPSV